MKEKKGVREGESGGEKRRVSQSRKERKKRCSERLRRNASKALPTPRARHATWAPPSGSPRERALSLRAAPPCLPLGRSRDAGSRERSSPLAPEEHRTRALGRSLSRPRTAGRWRECPSPTARCRTRGTTRSTTSSGPTSCTSPGKEEVEAFLSCFSLSRRVRPSGKQSISLFLLSFFSLVLHYLSALSPLRGKAVRS